MELIKKLTGKNPSEYEPIAKAMIDNSDIELFKKLVGQDNFLFDFIKENVARRIQKACNKDNYLNLLDFLDVYSSSYDTVIAQVLHEFGKENIFTRMKDLFLNGSDAQKAYAAKYFTFADKEMIKSLLPQIREASKSDFEPLAVNSTEVLSLLNDEVSKNEALENLKSKDEFEQFNAVKFLVVFGAKDAVPQIIEVMKKSSLSENIAAEIPYLISIEELIDKDFDNGMLVLCNIVNAMPEIIPLSAVFEYNMFELFENLYCSNLTGTSALLLMMAKKKFETLIENEEYLFDCDRNTKEEVQTIGELLAGVNTGRLNSLLYEELYDESDFVFFAIDFVDEIAELEALLESKNQTLILKILTLMKEKGILTPKHKESALQNITNQDIKRIVEVM